MYQLNRLSVKQKLRSLSVTYPDEKPSHLISDAINEKEDVFTEADVAKFRRLIHSRRSKVFKKLPKTKKTHCQH